MQLIPSIYPPNHESIHTKTRPQHRELNPLLRYSQKEPKAFIREWLLRKRTMTANFAKPLWRATLHQAARALRMKRIIVQRKAPRGCIVQGCGGEGWARKVSCPYLSGPGLRCGPEVFFFFFFGGGGGHSLNLIINLIEHFSSWGLTLE